MARTSEDVTAGGLGPYTYIVDAAGGGDYTDLQSAIDALAGAAGKIFVKAGTYTVGSAGIRISGNNITIEGEGPATRFNFNSSSLSVFLKTLSGTTQRTVNKFINFRISQQGTAGTGTAVDYSYFTENIFENIRIDGCNIGFTGTGTGTLYNRFYNCTASVSGASSKGFECGVVANENAFYSCRSLASGATLGAEVTTGFAINAHSNKLIDCVAETHHDIGIDIQAAGNDTTIVGAYLELNKTNIQLASGVEAVTFNGGFSGDGTTSNLSDLGAKGLHIDNMRIQYEPYTKLRELNEYIILNNTTLAQYECFNRSTGFQTTNASLDTVWTALLSEISTTPAVITFGAGTFTTVTGLAFEKSNITVRGQGMGVTIITADSSTGADSTSVFECDPTQSSTGYSLTSDATAGDLSLTMSLADQISSGLVADDYFIMYSSLGIDTEFTGRNQGELHQVESISNVTKTASTIAFVNSNPDTITDSGNGFVTAGFTAGTKIRVTGSASNNSVFTIATVTAGTITLVSTDSLVAEAAGASVTIRGVISIGKANDGTHVYQTMTVANTAKVAKLTMYKNINIRGITFTDAATSRPSTFNAGTVVFRFVDNLSITDCQVRDAYNTGFFIGQCMNVKINGCHLKNMKDVTPNANVFYGIAAKGATINMTVQNCTFDNMRHGFVQGAGNSTYYAGTTRNVSVSGCTSVSTYAAHFDCHQGCEGLSFVNNTMVGDDGAANGIQTRSPATITGNTIIGVLGKGVSLFGAAHGSVVSSNFIKGCTDGIYVDRGVNKVVIDGNTITGGTRGGQLSRYTASVTISNASPGVVTYADHNVIAGTQVVFTTANTLPVEIVSGTVYYVIATGITKDSFQISATEGGAAINTSGGSGTHTIKIRSGNDSIITNNHIWGNSSYGFGMDGQKDVKISGNKFTLNTLPFQIANTDSTADGWMITENMSSRNTSSNNPTILGTNHTIYMNKGFGPSVENPYTRDMLLVRGQGLINQNFPPYAATTAGLMVSQTVYFGLIGLLKGDIITNIHVAVSTTGTTTTNTFVALYNSAGNRLAVSNDLTTALDSTGMKTLALSSAYTILSDGAYYIAILTVNGTPANCATLVRGTSNNSVMAAVGSGVKVDGTQTGQSTMPSSATISAGTTFGYWMGVS